MSRPFQYFLLLVSIWKHSLAFRGGWLSDRYRRPYALIANMARGQGFGMDSSGDGSLDDAKNIDPLDGLSEERKANLFQFLLRDLQVENVPLLGVDADQVHTLQAALWTIMSEMSDKDGADKACVILEEIPIDALRSFVDDFMILKTEQPRLMEQLPELERFNLSLLGKGVGPAIVVEVAARNTTTSYTIVESTIESSESAKKSMQSFVERSSSTLEQPTTLSANELQAVAYRSCLSSNAFHVLSAFWNAVCELLTSSPDSVSTSVLLLPALLDHGAWSCRAELASRSLCLYNGDAVLEPEHHHPKYDRDSIYPPEKPAHGHVPPSSYLAPMLEKAAVSIQCSVEDLRALNNAQRQAPVPSIVIRRVDLIEEDTTIDNRMVQLKVGGKSVLASGVPAYATNIERLYNGLQAWQASFAEEKGMWTP